jgi:oligoribonuclease NrnB/cAMP/cGMP phosphodiesterase (DHH superfamily)
MDGVCSAAIVKKFYDDTKDVMPWFDEVCEFIRIDYRDEFPFDKIVKDELIVIVDFSLQKEGEFYKLMGITDNIIWIDHHKTAIEKHQNLTLSGVRRDGVAGCELTWEFFFPGIKIPKVVELLADYDIWAFKFGEDTNKLQTGIRLYDTNPESENWDKWLHSHYYPAEELEKGEIALKYRNRYYAGLIKGWSFMTAFEGYRVIACNAGSVSSQLFDSVTEDYDLMMPFCWDGKQWTVSIYTKKDIDCSALAKKYGGGGHKSAAGFQCKDLPFESVIKEV